jgi:proteasome lid subunit RPN8/RPN11
MNKPKIYLSLKAYQKMRLWVEMAQGEISWLGTVSELRDSDGDLDAFLIEDIHLLKQICSSANTVLDDPSVGQFLTEMVIKGEDASKVKAWLHSHANMKCFWSNIDEDCIGNLANSSYFISIVTNKEGSILARIDIFKPFHITVNDVSVDIYYPTDKDLKTFCKTEFKEKVTESVFIPAAPVTQGFPGMTDIDREFDELENKVSTGKISLEEYQHEVAKLEVEMDPYLDIWERR